MSTTTNTGSSIASTPSSADAARALQAELLKAPSVLDAMVEAAEYPDGEPVGPEVTVAALQTIGKLALDYAGALAAASQGVTDAAMKAVSTDVQKTLVALANLGTLADAVAKFAVVQPAENARKLLSALVQPGVTVDDVPGLIIDNTVTPITNGGLQAFIQEAMATMVNVGQLSTLITQLGVDLAKLGAVPAGLSDLPAALAGVQSAVGRLAQAPDQLSSATVAGAPRAADSAPVSSNPMGTAGNDNIQTGDGSQDVAPRGGNDNVNTGAGDDTITLRGDGSTFSADGSRTDDGSAHFIDGGAGNDTLKVQGSVRFTGRLANVETIQIDKATRAGAAATDVPGQFTVEAGAPWLSALAEGAEPIKLNGTGTLRVATSNALVVDPANLASGNRTQGTTIRLDALNLRDTGGVQVLVDGSATTGEKLDLSTLGNAQLGEVDQGLTIRMVGLNEAGAGSTAQSTEGNTTKPLLVQQVDRIDATNFRDSITGSGGNDIIDGKGSNDTLDGGDGDDYLIGGSGSDFLIGGKGNDTIDGGTGDSMLMGGEGNDVLRVTSSGAGGAASFQANGGDGIDRLVFTADATDSSTLDFNLDELGNPTRTITDIEEIEVNRSGEALGNTSVGIDASLITTPLTILGHAGRDVITGGSGNDTLIGRGGSDTLLGGEGDDTFVLLKTEDYVQGGTVVDGGSGSGEKNTISIQAAKGTEARFVFSKQQVTFVTAIDASKSEGAVEVHAEDFTDPLTVTGGKGADVLEGGRGNDTLNGGEGNDTLFAAGGNDVLNGGAGIDRAVVVVGTAGMGAHQINLGGEKGEFVEFTLDEGASGQTLTVSYDGAQVGKSGSTAAVGSVTQVDITNASLRADSGLAFKVITTNPDSNPSATFQSVDLLTTGDDVLSLSAQTGNAYVDAGSGQDSITGGSGMDLLRGGAGNDTLAGNAGDDNLFGGDGSDSLLGGDGADTLVGGIGNDVLNGGADVDTAVFAGELSASSFSVSNNRLLVNVGSGHTDTLQNVERVRSVFTEDSGTTEKIFLIVGTGGFASLQQAIDAVAPGNSASTTILVTESTIGKAEIGVSLKGLKIEGLNGAVLTGGIGVSADEVTISNLGIKNGETFLGEIAGIYVNADRVTLKGLSITREGFDGNASLAQAVARAVLSVTGKGQELTIDSVSASGFTQGVFLNPGATNAEVVNSTLTGNRGGISNENPDNFTVTGTTFNNGGGQITLVAMDQVENLSSVLGNDNQFATNSLQVRVIVSGQDGQKVTGTQVGDQIAPSPFTTDISGGDGNDTVDGGDGNDTIAGDAGADSILGGAGNDVLSGGIGSDIIDGGTGTDTALFERELKLENISIQNGKVTVRSAPASGLVGLLTPATGEVDTLTGIERLVQVASDGAMQTVFLIVGNGGFATLQEAINAVGAAGEAKKTTILVTDNTNEGAVTIPSGLDGLKVKGLNGAALVGGIKVQSNQVEISDLSIKQGAGFISNGNGNATDVAVYVAAAEVKLTNLNLTRVGTDGSVYTDQSAPYGIFTEARPNAATPGKLTVSGVSASGFFQGIRLKVGYEGTEITNSKLMGNRAGIGIDEPGDLIRISGTTFQNESDQITLLVTEAREDLSQLLSETNTFIGTALKVRVIVQGKGTQEITGTQLADSFDAPRPFADGNIAPTVKINGGAGNDTINGGTGNDTLSGDAGNDSLLGGAGNDSLIGGAGNDVIDGGEGVDSVVFSQPLTADSIQTMAGQVRVTTSDGGTDTLTNVERFVSSDGQIFLLVGNSGFANIQAAVNSLSGATADQINKTTILITASSTETVTIPGAFAGLKITGRTGVELTGGILVNAARVQLSNLTIKEGAQVPGQTDLATVFVNASDVKLSNLTLSRSGFDGTTLSALNGGVTAPKSHGVMTTGTLNAASGLVIDQIKASGFSDGLFLNNGAAGAKVTNSTLTGNRGGIVLNINDEGLTETSISGTSFNNTGAQITVTVFDQTESLAGLLGEGNTFATGPVPKLNIYAGGAETTQSIIGTAIADALDLNGSRLTEVRNTHFSGGAGDDTINGGAGDDTLSGDEGQDILNGGTGNDVLMGGLGNDTIDGGENLTGLEDVDTVVYGNVTLDKVQVTDTKITVQVSATETDTLTNVEKLVLNGKTHLIVGKMGFQTIQAAISAANDGDVIVVPAGTFNETLTIDKSVTILGANQGKAATGARSAETIVGAITVTAANVTVDGVTITKPTAMSAWNGVSLSVSAANATIKNNIIEAFGPAGGFADFGFVRFKPSSSGTFEANVIRQGSGYDASTDERGVFGLAIDSTGDVKITNNNISVATSNSNAVAIFGSGAYEVTGNTIVGKLGANGTMQFKGGIGVAQTFTSLKIANNTVSNYSADGKGIAIEDYAGLGATVVISGNSVTGNDPLVVNAHSLLKYTRGAATASDASILDTTIDLEALLAGNPNIEKVLAVIPGTVITTFAFNGTNVNTAQAGGLGKDTLIGTARFDYLLGGTEDDSLNGGDGDDILDGGAGNDLVQGGAGNDLFIESAGVDTTEGGEGLDTLKIQLAGATPFGRDVINLGGDFGDKVSIEGLDTGREVLVGIASASIGAANGVVRLYNQAAGSIPSDLNAESHAQVRSTNVSVFGDRLRVLETTETRDSSGNATAVTPVGSAIQAEFTAVHILTAAADEITVPTGNSTNPRIYLNAGGGNDVIAGSLVADFLDGGTGDDQLKGNNGNDTLMGGEGNDTLDGGAGSDSILGGNGVDTATIQVNSSDLDVVDLGSNPGDTVKVTGGQAITLTLPTGAGTGAADQISLDTTGASVEPFAKVNSTNISFLTDSLMAITATAAGLQSERSFKQVSVGSSGADVLRSVNDQSAYLFGGAGNDTITGGSESDWIIGGTGADSLVGGAGNDVFVINGTAQFAAGEVINGGDGVDTVRYVSSINDETLQLSSSVTGIEAVQVKYGGAANGAPNSAASFKLNVNAAAITNALQMTGHEGANLLVGGAGDDTIDGGAGNDILTGSQGNDMLLGGAGADQLSGGEGNDTLVGGAGADTLTGGVGADAFVFSFGDRAARDTVRDFFRSEGDVIRFEGFGISALTSPTNDGKIKAYTATNTDKSLVNAANAKIVQVDLGASAVSDLQLTDTTALGKLVNTTGMGSVFAEEIAAAKFIALIVNGSAPVRVVLVEDGGATPTTVSIIGTISNLNSSSGSFLVSDFGFGPTGG